MRRRVSRPTWRRCWRGASCSTLTPIARSACIQILGGMGFTWEHDAHLHLRRAIGMRQLCGGSGPLRAEAARASSRRWPQASLELELPAGRRGRARRDHGGVVAEVAETDDPAERRRRVRQHGLIAPHWPPPYGRDAGPIEQLVIDEELARRSRAASDISRSGRGRCRRSSPTGRSSSRSVGWHRRSQARCSVVPALQRARGRKRPGVAVDARRSCRGRLRSERPEGLDEHRPEGGLGDLPRPDRPRCAQARRDHVLPRGHEVRGDRDPAASRDHGRRDVQRGLLHRMSSFLTTASSGR